MPNQSKIIDAVNYCLKQRGNIDFELNDGGVCAGLAALYVKYSLENKTKQFFDILTQLSHLSKKDYQLGDNATLDNFIIQLQEVFDPAQYSSNRLQQGDIEHILRVKEKPLRNEFNLGLITDEASWADILKQISQENRVYSIYSHNHAIALFFKDGIYTVYDPNYNVEEKKFSSPEAVIEEFKKCLFYTDTVFGLSIRAFTHSEESIVNYPKHEALHDLAFEKGDFNKRTSIVDEKKLDEQYLQSTLFASAVRDTNTLAYLFETKSIYWDKVAREYLNDTFNTMLLNESPSLEIKKALLKSIQVNIYTGNIEIIQKLVGYFNETFTSLEDQNELKTQLQNTFSLLETNQLGVMKQVKNLNYLLSLCEQYQFNLDETICTQYNHLKMLTLISEEQSPQTFIKTLTPLQLIKQIQLSATLNQHKVLGLLITQLKEWKIDAKKHPSIFTENLMNSIDAITLDKVLKAGFVADSENPEILRLSSLRKDKTIFELYARSFSADEKSDLWQHISKPNELLDLESKIGPIFLLNALIFLKKNKQIKVSWNDSISVECIQGALMDAITQGDSKISIFLKDKLDLKKGVLDDDTINFLLQKALDDKNINSLIALTELNYNVLQKITDINRILRLCSDYDNFAIIYDSFAKASPEIKKKMLEMSIRFDYQAVIDMCMDAESAVFTALLTDWINKPDSKNRTSCLSKMDKQLTQHPYYLRLDFTQEKLKTFFSYCLHHKLFMFAHRLSTQVLWGDSEAELKQLFTELVHSRNEVSLIELCKIHPDLVGDNPELFNSLVQNGLLDTVTYLLPENKPVAEDLLMQLVTDALNNDNKKRMELLLQKGILLAETKCNPPLSDLVKEAIKKGHSRFIEPFIESNRDYGLDFKALFQWSCACQQPQIANALLTKEITLSNEEMAGSLKQLYGDASFPVLADLFYQKAYAKLYGLLVKSHVETTHIALNKAIINAVKEKDVALLTRSIEDEDPAKFKIILKQSNLSIGDEVITFLKDPFLNPAIFTLIENEYAQDELLAFALEKQEWVAVANIIERHKMGDFEEKNQEAICNNRKLIVPAFVENIKGHLGDEKVQTRVFQLYNTNTNPNALTLLVTINSRHIQEAMANVKSVHHYQSNPNRPQALKALSKSIKACNAFIEDQKINLELPIENTELINQYAKIKALKVKADVLDLHSLFSKKFSKEEAKSLVEPIATLGKNPTFTEIDKHEWTLFCLIKECNLKDKPLSEQSEANKQRINKSVMDLQNILSQQNILTKSFLLPDVKRVIDANSKIQKLNVQVDEQNKDNRTANQQARDNLAANIGPNHEYVLRLETLWNAVEYMKAYGSTLPDTEQKSVVDLSVGLVDKLNQFITNNQYEVPEVEDFETFKTDFNRHLHSKDGEMSQHRDAWVPILLNIGIALTGLGAFIIGVQLVVSKLSTGRASFFFEKTNRQENIDEVQQSMDELSANVKNSKGLN